METNLEHCKSMQSWVCNIISKIINASVLSVGPLCVVFGPGTQKGEQERLNWPTHYRRSKLIYV